MRPTGGELVARTLSAFGVEVAFVLHGGHLDALLVGCQAEGIRLVDTRHEAVAVNAADGYARASGGVGVAFATAGAGFLNAISGLGPAAVDRSPILVITSSPPLRDAETNALQGFVDQVAMAAPLTKWAHRITVVEEIPRLVSLALRKAVTGTPGPVLLDIPIDVLFGRAAADRVSVGAGPDLPCRPAPAAEGVTQALDLLRSAERPVVIAGGGVRGLAPCPELVAFAELTGIPVFHPGMISGAMPPEHALNGYVARNLTGLDPGPDVVLMMGTRFGFYLGGRGGSVVPLDAQVIQVDIDGAEIGRLRPFTVGITADARETLRAFVCAGQDMDWPDRGEWAAEATGMHRRTPPHAAEDEVVKDRIHPYHALRTLLRAVEPGSTVVVDGGEVAAWATMSLHEARPHRTMGCGYLGYLGITPGLAIGAQVAEPDRRVVLVIGDGGMGFHAQEFDTMVRHGLPILTIVVNNEQWAMSRHGQTLLYGESGELVSSLADTDYDRVAAGWGAYGERVTELADLGAAVARALASGGPACLNVSVSGDVVHPVIASMVDTVGAGDDDTVLPYYDSVPDKG